MPGSETRETSFYEVALTNRQVMVAFAFLLVGLLVAFLSGVWVGKTAAPPAIAQEAVLRVVEPEPATASGPAPDQRPGGPSNWPAEGAAADPDASVPRLDYFAEGEAPTAGDAPTAADAHGQLGDGALATGEVPTEAAVAGPNDRVDSRAGTAASVERGAAAPPGPPASPQAAPPGPQPAPGAQPAAAPHATATREPSSQPSANPPARDPSQPKPKWQQRRELANEAERLESEFAREEADLEGAQPASGARPAAPLPAGGRGPAPASSSPPQAGPPAPPISRPAGAQFLVQVFSSKDAAKAREILTTLQDAGYPASLSRSELASGVTYRVRIGPYRDRPAAQKVADDVSRRMRVDTWITTE